ncbi:MAG: sigma factor-like helix-turn-helix DNA-binding protein [Rikenellaceae bacterium]
MFSLRYYNELSYKEIEKITDTSQSALKVSYHLAEKKIKEYISSFLL